MPTTTVPGGPAGHLTFSYGGTSGLTVAQQIANALGAAFAAGTLTQNTVSASTGPTTIAAPTVSGGTSDLIIESVTGSTTVIAPTVPGVYIATNNSTTPSTVTAGANVQLFTGTVGGVYTATGTGAEIGALGGINTITASAPGETIGGGTGSDLLIATGGDVVVTDGSDTITLSGTGNLVIGSTLAGSVSALVTDGGSNDTIVAGANPMTVTATGTSTIVGSGTQIYAGSGSLTFVGGVGTASVLGGTGAESLTAGSGGIVYGANTDSSATVNSGTGGVTIFGGPGDSVSLTGSFGTAAKPDYLIAGSGNETLNASASSSPNFFADIPGTVAASVAMIGGSGNDTMLAGAGAGSVTMTGGAGSNVFAFFKQAAGGAKDVVTDFNSSDSVYIEGYASTGSAAALLQSATVGTGGVTLTLSDGTSVTFSNLVSPATLVGKIQYG